MFIFRYVSQPPNTLKKYVHYMYKLDSGVARILVRGRPQWRHNFRGVRGHAPPKIFWNLGLWNGISCILRALLSKIYRFEIPFWILGPWNGISCILSVLLSKIYRLYLVKKCFRTFRGGDHGRMAPPLNTLLKLDIKRFGVVRQEGLRFWALFIENILLLKAQYI